MKVVSQTILPYLRTSTIFRVLANNGDLWWETDSNCDHYAPTARRPTRYRTGRSSRVTSLSSNGAYYAVHTLHTECRAAA